MYFFFLEWALPKIVGVNEYFQSDKVVITQVDEKIKSMYTELLLGYISREKLNKIKLVAINPENQTLFLPFSQMYLGIKVMRELQTPVIMNEKQKVIDFLYRCRQFLITVCLEIKSRYDLSENNLLAKVAWLTPKTAVSTDLKRPSSIEPLIKEVTRIIAPENLNLIQLIDDQWRKLPYEEAFKNLVSLPTTEPITIDLFWYKIRETLTLDEKYNFKELGQFALDVLALPHSNASCERLFSKVNRIKTDSRNKLLPTTLQGILSASECISQLGCENFEPTKKMLDSMTANNIYMTSNTMKENHNLLSNVCVSGIENFENEQTYEITFNSE